MQQMDERIESLRESITSTSSTRPVSYTHLICSDVLCYSVAEYLYCCDGTLVALIVGCLKVSKVEVFRYRVAKYIGAYEMCIRDRSGG